MSPIVSIIMGSTSDLPVIEKAAQLLNDLHCLLYTSTSFYETLRQQLGEQDLTPHQRELDEYLIGSLNHDGLLRESLHSISDELASYAGIDASPEELEEVLKIIQDFEPAGLGARTLQAVSYTHLVNVFAPDCLFLLIF